MKITHATREAMKYACLNFHYAKSVPVNPLGYNIYNDKGEWCGCVLYAHGATANIAKPYNLCQGEILELVRVALNGKQSCTSEIIAATLKQIKKDCPLVRLIVSYADCDQKHLGTIYQATNWIYEGTNNKGSRCGWIVHGKKMHPKSIYSKIVTIDGKRVHCPQTTEFVKKFFDPNAIEIFTDGKRKYLFPLDRNMRKQLLPLAKPYPKDDECWRKIDRAKFKHEDNESIKPTEP